MRTLRYVHYCILVTKTSLLYSYLEESTLRNDLIKFSSRLTNKIVWKIVWGMVKATWTLGCVVGVKRGTGRKGKMEGDCSLSHFPSPSLFCPYHVGVLNSSYIYSLAFGDWLFYIVLNFDFIAFLFYLGDWHSSYPRISDFSKRGCCSSGRYSRIEGMEVVLQHELLLNKVLGT